MSSNSQDLIRTILLGNKKYLTEGIATSSHTDIVQRLSVALMLAKVSKHTVMESVIADINQNFARVFAIVQEACVKLPEEEEEVKQAVKSISEEDGGGAGVAPANVSAGIDASTPRISPKNKENSGKTPVIVKRKNV